MYFDYLMVMRIQKVDAGLEDTSMRGYMTTAVMNQLTRPRSASMHFGEHLLVQHLVSGGA